MGQPLFHSFINYESILWLDGYNYYDYKGPKIIPGFIKFSELIQFNACKGFEDSLINKFADNLIEQCTLIILWLASTTEVFNGLNYRLVSNLFNKNYILFSSEMLTNFVHWVEKLKTDFEENGMEVLESIYAYDNSGLEKKTQILHLENIDKAGENENIDDGNIEFPISKGNENSTSLQTFGEFYLDKEDWNAISYLYIANINRMNEGWTNVIAENFSEINSIYVLKFKHYWFNKTDSRKLKSPFFHAWAVCKFSNCISVTFSIENDFASFGGDIITVQFKSDGQLSLEHKDDKTIHARHITSGRREKMGANLMLSSVGNIFHQQFRNDNNVEAFKRGNFTNLISQQTLRRIKSDAKSIERFSNDDLVDIFEIQRHLRSVLPDDPIPGYVQYIVQEPFIIHLYAKRHIEVFKLFKHDNIVLNIDATGSLIKDHQRVGNLFIIMLLHCNTMYTVLALCLLQK